MYYIQLLKCYKPLAHYLARLLHPNYKELSSVISRKRKQNSGQQIIRWNCCLLLLTLIQEDEASLYPQSFCVPQVSILVPVSWWKSLKRVSKTCKIQNLADVMIHLLSCTASSASVEQVFSSFRLIYKLRNLLVMDHETELVFRYRMLCGCSAEDDCWPLLAQWILTTNF